MSRRRFLVDPAELQRETVELPPAEAAHALKVLRLGLGDEVWLLDGAGGQARAVLQEAGSGAASCRVVERLEQAEPLPRLVVLTGLLKNPAMDLVMVKLTELMAQQVRPVVTKRSVAGLAKGDKLGRWQRLAVGALKQSGAPLLPRIFDPQPLEQALDQAPASALRLMLYEDERALSLAQALADAPEHEEVWLLIGPEGGFDLAEVELAREAGFTICGLPGAMLRAETAAIAAAAVVRFGGC